MGRRFTDPESHADAAVELAAKSISNEAATAAELSVAAMRLVLAQEVKAPGLVPAKDLAAAILALGNMVKAEASDRSDVGLGELSKFFGDPAGTAKAGE